MSVLELLGENLRKQGGETVKASEALNRDVLALYFSAHWCPPCRGFTPTLCEKYTELVDAGKSLEMVFVSSDKDDAAFNEYHDSMTFLGMPFDRREEKEALSKIFKVQGIPTLVFYDLKEKKVITIDGREEITDDNFIANFPYKPETFTLAMLGENLRKPGGEMVKASAALNTDVLALYFSAHWCPPCRGFTPTLCQKYTALVAAGKSLEMVFVSSDKDDAAFNDYHDTMTFLALPFADRGLKEKLSKIFKVKGIPSLVFIDAKTGEVITSSGRGGVTSDTFIEDFPYHPKPMYDLAECTDGINDEVCLLVLMEAAPADTQKALSDMLLEIAVEEKKKPEAEQIATRFYTGKGGGPVGQVRKLCGYPAIVSAHKHPLKAMNKASGWYCDGCNKGGEECDRFRCSEGCDFDYCSECNKKTSEDVGEAGVPVLLLMNFEEGGAHYHPLEDSKQVNKENALALLDDFKNGKLQKRTPSR